MPRARAFPERLAGAAGVDRRAARACGGGRDRWGRDGGRVRARRSGDGGLDLRPGARSAGPARAGPGTAGGGGGGQPGEAAPRARESRRAGAAVGGQRSRRRGAGAGTRKRHARPAPGPRRGPGPAARAPRDPPRGRPRFLVAARAGFRPPRPGCPAAGPLPGAEGERVDPGRPARDQRAVKGALKETVPHFSTSSPPFFSLPGLSSIVNVSTGSDRAFDASGTSSGSPDERLTSTCHLSGVVLVAVRTYSPGGTT